MDNSKPQCNGLWHTSGGNSTQDRVFLLSCAEARRYLHLDESRNNLVPRLAPTAYAANRGAWRNSDVLTADGEASGWWWLRSPGYQHDMAAIIDEYGALGTATVVNAAVCVRPALWVTISAAPSSPASSVGPGDTVTFGNFRQDSDSPAGVRPIEWLVLDVQDGRALLLSRYCLYALWPEGDSSWENSNVRSWLNSEFLPAAFSGSQRDAILLTEVDNSAGQSPPDWSVPDGPATTDRLFLLSWAEAHRYFGTQVEVLADDEDAALKSRAAATALAMGYGLRDWHGFTTIDGESSVDWLLRTPNYGQSSLSWIDYSGKCHYFGTLYYASVGLRPAMWVDLTAAGF